MTVFLDAVRTFFTHLAAVAWGPLAVACACHASRLVVRTWAWRNILQAAFPETRVKWGIHQLPGGKAIFAPMSVRENLEMAGFMYRTNRADRRERFERALSIFPELG